jgi:PAT family beta-lactamase induction signal transducer AmpG
MQISKIFTDLKFSKIFIFGIISGMPFAVMYTVLMAWLNHFAIDFAVVTIIALAKMPYSLKFLWSPLLDYFKPPLLGRLLGPRRSWMFLTSLGIATTLFYLSTCTPSLENFNQMFCFGVLLCFFAASYDISYDALRIEMLEPDEQTLGSAHASLAFRLGNLGVGYSSLLVANDYGWSTSFQALSAAFAIAAVLSLVVQTSLVASKKETDFFSNTYASFKDLIAQKNFALILATIVLYKLGDAMLSIVGMKFYTVAGFTLKEIAWVVKKCGFIAAIIGSYVGGIIMARYGKFKGLMICGIAQMVTNLGYIFINHSGGNVNVFLAANFAENFTGGMGGGAIGGYLAMLCNVKFAATHFALLCSCSTFMNNTITSQAGKLVALMGWDMYFVFTAVISLPALLIIYILDKKNKRNSS